MELQVHGKTEVYLQLIQNVINKNKTAIVLVPEISLTPQMVDRFLARFGDCIAVLHSKLSIGERYDQWKNIKEQKAKIVIGARSAIFAPIENLGIIIIDEEHDQSYKSETSPRYKAQEIARYLAKQNNIPVVLGSATPDVGTFTKAKNGEIELIGLKINGINTERITGIGFAHSLVKNAAKNNIPLALVGAKPNVIKLACENLKKEFADLNIVYSHDGYFTDKEKIIEDLKYSCPKILLVALGAPKQEELIYELKSILPSTLMIGIGGSFDVWAGTVKRAPKIWQKLGLEWLYRTIKQPERFRRIFPTLPIFVYNVIKERLIKKG